MVQHLVLCVWRSSTCRIKILGHAVAVIKYVVDLFFPPYHRPVARLELHFEIIILTASFAPDMPVLLQQYQEPYEWSVPRLPKTL